MTDLFSVMSKLVDVNGQILVPGIYEKVRAISGNYFFVNSHGNLFLTRNN